MPEWAEVPANSANSATQAREARKTAKNKVAAGCYPTAIGAAKVAPHSDDPATKESLENRALSRGVAEVAEVAGEPLSRDDLNAGQPAYQAAAVAWMNANPPADLHEDRCAGCGELLGEIGSDAVPVLAGGGAHAWIHHGECHRRFQAGRKAEAVKALAEMGINPPTENPA